MACVTRKEDALKYAVLRIIVIYIIVMLSIAVIKRLCFNEAIR